MRLAADEDQLPAARDARDRHRHQAPGPELGHGAAARQQRQPHSHLHRPLDAVEARQRDDDLQLDAPLLEEPQHAVARRRRIVVRHERLGRHLLHRHRPAPRERVRGRHEQNELVAADGHLEQPGLDRMKRQRAEVEAPLLHFDRDLSRGHAADVDGDVGILLAKARDERQQGVHGRLVGADQHAAAPQVAQFAHGRLRLLGEPHEAAAVVLQHAAGVGQRAVLRRPVEERFAEAGLEAPDGLADGGLGAVHFGGGAREAALLGDGQEDRQSLHVHKWCLSYRNYYHFDFYDARRLQLTP